jgi:probable HAF family extracellular repeat protein
MTKKASAFSGLLWISLATILLLSPTQACAQIKYSVTDLGDLPGVGLNAVEATGINNSGQVVGFCGYSAGFLTEVYHAFLYSGGQMQDLGILSTLPFRDSSYATGINNAGQVVGYSFQAGLIQSWNGAFLYSGGQMQDLGNLLNNPLIGQGAAANGINNTGQIVGWSVTGDGSTSHAFLYSGGQMQDLGTIGGTDLNSSAIGINDSGQVAGDSYTAGGAEHAFLYSGGKMQDLGTLGGTSSTAIAINNAGQVVGLSTTAGGAQDVFLYSAGQMQDLNLSGPVPDPVGINDAGQIVGYSSAGNGAIHASLYTGGTTVDLNTLINPASGWTLEKATAINDVGQIVGYGSRGAFLLSLLGDFTHQGVVNASDIDLLYANFTAKTGTYNSLYDLTGDGVVDQADVTYLLQNVLNTNYGDANLDGKTDFVDFQTLLNHWQNSGAGWAGGDFNGDGVVDFLDFQMILNYWNPAGWNFAPSQVPEPTCMTMILLGGVALLRRKA